MADKKISALTAASTPLAGTEVLPIVQTGSTVKVSVADLTAGRTQTSNGIVQGTAATGYNFNANTPAAGMTSQLLNWYEEGTWTPDQGSGLVVVGAFSSSGKYTRVGRQVTISAAVQGATTIACTSAGLICTNLPFTAGTASSGSATTGNANQSSTLLVASTVVFCSSAIAATAGGITFSSTYFV